MINLLIQYLTNNPQVVCAWYSTWRRGREEKRNRLAVGPHRYSSATLEYAVKDPEAEERRREEAARREHEYSCSLAAISFSATCFLVNNSVAEKFPLDILFDFARRSLFSSVVSYQKIFEQSCLAVNQCLADARKQLTSLEDELKEERQQLAEDKANARKYKQAIEKYENARNKVECLNQFYRVYISKLDSDRRDVPDLAKLELLTLASELNLSEVDESRVVEFAAANNFWPMAKMPMPREPKPPRRISNEDRLRKLETVVQNQTKFTVALHDLREELELAQEGLSKALLQRFERRDNEKVELPFKNVLLDLFTAEVLDKSYWLMSGVDSKGDHSDSNPTNALIVQNAHPNSVKSDEELCLEMANKGDVLAIGKLGLVYKLGCGLSQDERAALQLWHKLTERDLCESKSAVKAMKIWD